MPALMPIFTTGDLVLTHEISKACAASVKGEINSFRLTIRCYVTNSEENNVLQDRRATTVLLRMVTARSGIARSVARPPSSNQSQAQSHSNAINDSSISRRHPFENL